MSTIEKAGRSTLRGKLKQQLWCLSSRVFCSQVACCGSFWTAVTAARFGATRVVGKGPSSQGYGFSSGHVWMWELDYRKGWVPKNWCFWTVALEKILESPLDCKEIKSTNPKGNQFWIFIGRTDAEAEAPILWVPDARSQLIRKDPDAEKDWRQEEKRVTEEEMVGWYDQLNGHEFEQAPGGDEGQGSLVGYSPWGRKESDTTERLNNIW